MGVLRFLYRLILGVWVGGILYFGSIVAPALFRVLSPEQAALVVRQVLPRMDVFGLGAGALLVVLSLVHDGSPRAWSQRGRLGLLLVMLSCAAASFFWVTPRMDALRRGANDSISSLPKEDPVRREFGALHGVSATLMLAQLAFGLGALALGPRRRTRGQAQAQPSTRVA